MRGQPGGGILGEGGDIVNDERDTECIGITEIIFRNLMRSSDQISEIDKIEPVLRKIHLVQKSSHRMQSERWVQTYYISENLGEILAMPWASCRILSLRLSFCGSCCYAWFGNFCCTGDSRRWKLISEMHFVWKQNQFDHESQILLFRIYSANHKRYLHQFRMILNMRGTGDLLWRKERKAECWSSWS